MAHAFVVGAGSGATCMVHECLVAFDGCEHACELMKLRPPLPGANAVFGFY